MIRPTMRRAKSTGSSRAPTMMRRQTSDQGRRPVKKLVVSMKKSELGAGVRGGGGRLRFGDNPVAHARVRSLTAGARPWARVGTRAEKTALPANFEEDTWAKLKVAVDAVHAQTSVAYSREELYHVRATPPPRSQRV